MATFASSGLASFHLTTAAARGGTACATHPLLLTGGGTQATMQNLVTPIRHQKKYSNNQRRIVSLADKCPLTAAMRDRVTVIQERTTKTRH